MRVSDCDCRVYLFSVVSICCVIFTITGGVVLGHIFYVFALRATYNGSTLIFARGFICRVDVLSHKRPPDG